MNAPTPAAQFRYLLNHEFGFFLRKVFRVVSPADAFLDNWHYDAIAFHLEEVMAGRIRRLIITMPPRYGKSICASIALPAYMLGRNPAASIICVSYAQDLAAKLGNDTRSVMREEWYRNAFPRTRLAKETEQELTTTVGGSRLATSTGGVLTGRGGNLIIVDDPIKPQDAMSDLAREKAKEWMENTLFTRLNDKINGAIVVVMQRLHEDDPVGHLLEKGGWTHLNLPARAVGREEVATGSQRMHVRNDGDLLHPEREPAEQLARQQHELGSANFFAQYQQAPISPHGNLVRWDWFKFYDLQPPFVNGEDQTIISWDTAMKATELSDYSVGTVWLVKKKTQFYLLNVIRKKIEYPALRQLVQQTHEGYRANLTLIEDKGSGTSLVQDLRCKIRLWPMQPEGDKETRMATVSPMIEAGQVFLPSRAEWLEDLKSEIMAFPRGRHDDQADSLSQFLAFRRLARMNTVRFGRTIGLY